MDPFPLGLGLELRCRVRNSIVLLLLFFLGGWEGGQDEKASRAARLLALGNQERKIRWKFKGFLIRVVLGSDAEF